MLTMVYTTQCAASSNAGLSKAGQRGNECKHVCMLTPSLLEVALNYICNCDGRQQVAVLLRLVQQGRGIWTDEQIVICVVPVKMKMECLRTARR